MAICATVEMESIGDIRVANGGYGRILSVELVNADIKESISVSEVVAEYEADDLLNEIGHGYVAEWLREQGFSVVEE